MYLRAHKKSYYCYLQSIIAFVRSQGTINSFHWYLCVSALACICLMCKCLTIKDGVFIIGRQIWSCYHIFSNSVKTNNIRERNLHMVICNLAAIQLLMSVWMWRCIHTTWKYCLELGDKDRGLTEILIRFSSKRAIWIVETRIGRTWEKLYLVM